MKRLLLLGALLVLAVPAAAARLPILASHDWWPVYSPNGQWVAFTRVAGQGRVMALEVVPAHGGRVVQLARASSQLLPSWSPDSTHLAYQSGGRVYTVARNGSDRRSVAAGLFPDWSPDGSAVAYVRDGTLRVAAKALATQVISKPDWSPDGTRIAFARSDGIHVVTLEGAERLVAPTAGEPSYPTWSPNGSKLAFDVAGRVYVVAPEEAAKPLLAGGPFSTVSPPSWSASGDALAYTGDGQLRATRLLPKPQTASLGPAEVGASYGPRIAYSAPRRACPGHSGIRLSDGPFLSGTCTIMGTAGTDVIEGTGSWGDLVLAGAGNDKVHVNDRHTDRVDCGKGRDEVWADRLDKLTGCEIVHR